MSDRQELERLRKLKRLRELEAKAAGSLEQDRPSGGSQLPPGPFGRTQAQAIKGALDRIGSFNDNFVQGVSFGFADEAVSGLGAATAGTAEGVFNAFRHKDIREIPRTIAATFNESQDIQARELAESREKHPITSGVGNVTGSLVGIGKASEALGKTALGKTVSKAPTSIKLAAGGAAAGGVTSAGEAEFGEKLEKGTQGAFIGGIASPVLNKALGGINHLLRKSNIKNAPAIQEIKEKATGLYKKAEQSGVRIRGKVTAKIAERMRDRMEKEGVRLPSGEIIDDSMTGLKGVEKTLKAFEGKEITPKQALTARTAFQNAANSPNKNEARVGKILLQRYDGFMSRVSPDLKEASKLWGRHRRAELVNTARTTGAEARTGQFTQAGIDNALRTEFRQILRGIDKNKLRGFSDAEREAIKLVANGSFIRNTAREAGKLAPNSSIGQLIGTGGIVGAGAVQAPGAGLAIAGILGTGYGGKALANRLAVQQAETAELLIRAGVDKAFVNRLSQSQQEQLALLFAAKIASQTDGPDRRRQSERQEE